LAKAKISFRLIPPAKAGGKDKFTEVFESFAHAPAFSAQCFENRFHFLVDRNFVIE